VKPIFLPSRWPGQADDRQLRRGRALCRSGQGIIEVAASVFGYDG
jgi:hypothetical protein